MRIAQLKIQNFRSIQTADLVLPKQVVFVGDNNSGKSTVLEAIDLVLGPERTRRRPVINEHDFYNGQYISAESEEEIEIKIEATVVDLNEEQEARFKDNLEFWNNEAESLIDGPPTEQTDQTSTVSAIRVVFIGKYDPEEDDFIGETFFSSPESDEGELEKFRTRDKRYCGFLFLRTLRTGSRALSLEHGSLLDIILRLREQRVQMWEDVLREVSQVGVAEDGDIGLTDTLTEVQRKLRSFIPTEWADDPRIRVSELTRESLRKALTVFMTAGSADSGYAVPFRNQGTGTVNMLVFALLSMIAEEKQNVMFAMEEPEIAIPPFTQKRVVQSVKESASQVLLTSHSPYVLEEFAPERIAVIHRVGGELTIKPALLPPTVKLKAFSSEMRTRFSEALLARRVLVVEGRTELDSFSAASRRLAELSPEQFRNLDSLGIAVVDARTDSQVVPLVQYFESLGKQVFAIFDKQEEDISEGIEFAFESPAQSFEKLLAQQCDPTVLMRFLRELDERGDWKLANDDVPNEDTPPKELKKVFVKLLKKFKGSGEAAELVSQLSEDEMPNFILNTLSEIQGIVEPAEEREEAEEEANGKVKLPKMLHEVAVDAEGPSLAGITIGRLLECESVSEEAAVDNLIKDICEHMVGRRGGKAPRKEDVQLIKGVGRFLTERKVVGSKRKLLVEECQRVVHRTRSLAYTGDPFIDWVSTRDIISESAAPSIQCLANDALHLRFLRKGASLRSKLTELWRSNMSYAGSTVAVRNAFTNEHFVAKSQKPQGLHVMTIHKSKGKEFDEVVIYEGVRWDRIVRDPSDERNVAQSTLLLRVGVSRASQRVSILTPQWAPCPLF